jgi:hypothetical protein
LVPGICSGIWNVASEAYRQDIPFAEAQGLFTKKELKAFGEKAKKLNQTEKGDQACFYLTKIG